MTQLKTLPFNINLNQIDLLLLLNDANYKIGVLSGLLNILPNPQIILSLINVGESKNSSEIENIYTTYEDIFKEQITQKPYSVASKEVLNYKQAIDLGYSDLQVNGFISTNSLVRIQEILEPGKGGIRKLPGTIIKNDSTGEIVHIPPQSEKEVRDYLSNLEMYINEDLEPYDPLIKMALIHYQFECIHPFYDGNGRTGRILNVLYLVMKKKISVPILYLSKYIVDHKTEYYSLLKSCNDDINNIVLFVEYILKAISETSQNTIQLIMWINELIGLTKSEMKAKCPDIYNPEIVDYIFTHLVTKNESFREALSISKNTATKYLKTLVDHGFLVEEQVGKEILYMNVQLSNIFR